MGKAAMVLGIILLLIGLFYVLAPHTLHVSTGLGFGLEHTMHQILGVVLVVVGVIILWKGRK